MRRLLLVAVAVTLSLTACGPDETPPQTPVPSTVDSPSPSPSDSPSPVTIPSPDVITPTTAAPPVNPGTAPTTKRPVTKPTTRKPAPRPTRTTQGPSNVTPGAFCAHAGATGLHNGIVYTCKTSPTDSKLRWRR